MEYYKSIQYNYGCMQIMEREQAHKIRKLFKLECRERNLSYKVENMERNISMLKEEYKKFLELKYNTVIHEKMGMRDIALELNMGKNRAYEPREKLVDDIARFNKNFGTKQGQSKTTLQGIKIYNSTMDMVKIQ